MIFIDEFGSCRIRTDPLSWAERILGTGAEVGDFLRISRRAQNLANGLELLDRTYLFVFTRLGFCLRML